MSDLTIITYHYVRPIIDSKFPKIKGLEIEGFKRQLDFLESEYSIVSTEQVIDRIKNNKPLPPKACWLTFDDGYKEHYKYVFPELINRNLTGAFFVPSSPIKENKMLGVNSIHHIIACVNDVNLLVKDLKNLCIKFGLSEEKFHENYKKYAVPNRFDNAETKFFKNMLQFVLPDKMRKEIISILFQKYLGVTEFEFSSNFYLSIDETKKLISNGMYVGSHGANHFHYDQTDAQKQKDDILSSLEFLEEVGASTLNWIMCYPHGHYNDITLSLLKELGALIGVTIEPRKANLGTDNPFILPRLDTNDFPQ